MQITLMFIFLFLGTIGSTTLGALLGIISLKFKKSLLNAIQNFVVGSLIGLIFIDFFPHSFEGFIETINNTPLAVLYSSLIILGTGLLFLLMHELLHHFSHHHIHEPNDEKSCDNHGHIKDVINSNSSSLIASLIFLGAISVHNIPEGLSLGVVFTNLNDYGIPLSGIVMSIVLAIHNLLIGFSMAQSFKNSNKSNLFSMIITISSSLLSFSFGIIGYYSNIYVNETINSIIMSISTGSILYVLFIELLPEIFYKYKSKYSFLFILIGILISAILLNI